MTRSPRSSQPPLPPSPLGGRVRVLRQARKLSQAELAAQLGVHSTHISRIEHDTYVPSVRLVQQLMLIFGVDANDLLMDGGPAPEETDLRKRLHIKIDRLSTANCMITESIVDTFNKGQFLKDIEYTEVGPRILSESPGITHKDLPGLDS